MYNIINKIYVLYDFVLQRFVQWVFIYNTYIPIL